MKQRSYKEFSLAAHVGNLALARPNTCQLELTYACGLRCSYCYAGSYNRPEYIARELDTAEIKKIIDELRSLGVLWLNFTGGDPLMRPDYCELYSYARDRGFLITVCTSGYSLKKEHLDLFKRQPPFSIEITLNAVEEGLYERISVVKGSYKKALAAIAAVQRNKLPLKIKTTVTKLNLGHIPEIKRYVRQLGLKFDADYLLSSGFDHDKYPLAFQVPPEAIPGWLSRDNDICARPPQKSRAKRNSFFTCAVTAGDAFQIDPYGNITLCFAIRRPRINVLKKGVAESLRKLIKYFKELDFKHDAECMTCAKRDYCWWCPGRAFVETGSLEKPIAYYCKLAKADEKR